MLYRNEKTGVVIDVTNSVLGGDRKPVEKKAENKTAKEPKPKQGKAKK